MGAERSGERGIFLLASFEDSKGERGSRNFKSGSASIPPAGTEARSAEHGSGGAFENSKRGNSERGEHAARGF